MTQRKLAELSDISEDYMCEIESKTKHKSFSIDVLSRIAKALDIDIKYFFITK